MNVTHPRFLDNHSDIQQYQRILINNLNNNFNITNNSYDNVSRFIEENPDKINDMNVQVTRVNISIINNMYNYVITYGNHQTITLAFNLRNLSNSRFLYILNNNNQKILLDVNIIGNSNNPYSDTDEENYDYESDYENENFSQNNDSLPLPPAGAAIPIQNDDEDEDPAIEIDYVETVNQWYGGRDFNFN